MPTAYEILSNFFYDHSLLQLTAKEISDRTKVNVNTVRKELTRLKKSGIIQYIYPRRWGYIHQ